MVRQSLPDGLRGGLLGPLGRLYPNLGWAPRRFRAKATFLELAASSLEGYFRSISVLNDDVRRRLFSPNFRRELQGYQAREQLARYFDKAPSEDPLLRAQYADVKTYLPGDILTKVDRASMASSLEVRAPILDHQFAEWTAGLSPSLKLHKGVGKYIFKRSLEGRLPQDILYRPKQGFAVPLATWFRGPLLGRIRNSLASSRIADTGWFDTGFIGTAIDQHASGLSDHSTLLWSMLMFEAFLRNADVATTPRHDVAVHPAAAVA